VKLILISFLIITALSADTTKINYENATDDYRAYTIKATEKSYGKWIEGFIQSGGTITHWYDYNSTRWNNILIATEDFKLEPLYGAASIMVIVPIGINVEYDELGHNNIYYLDGYRHDGFFVPCFNDIMSREDYLLLNSDNKIIVGEIK